MHGKKDVADRDQMAVRQRVLAEFGDFALQSEDLDEVLQEACRLVSGALQTKFSKVLEIEDGGKTLLVRAGTGWREGIVGSQRISMTERSSESYAIHKRQPVVTRNIDEEDRFGFPPFFREHKVAAITNVPIWLPGGIAYGVLQVDDVKPRDFGKEDVEFLRTYATVLGPVIDRLHKAHSLRDALNTNQQLLQELQHRVKNHLTIITSLVRLRSRRANSAEVREALEAVGERVETLRLIHEQLYAAGDTDHLKLREFVSQLVNNLCHLHDDETRKVTVETGVVDREVPTDIAVPLGLIINEFVTNSIKYAFDEEGGHIGVEIEALDDGRLRTRLHDDGRGLPVDAANSERGTGMKLIEGLARQLDVTATWGGGPGTQLTLEPKRR